MSGTLTRPPTSVAVVRREAGRRHRLVVAGLGTAVLGALAARVLGGDYTVTLPDLLRILAGDPLRHAPGAAYLVMEVKLPRAVLALLAGLAFGAGGALFQAVLRNPLASPDVVGVSLGASAAGVVAVVTLGLGGAALSVAAVVGALLTAAFIRLVGGHHPGRIVVVGVVTAAGLQALIQYLFTRADSYDAQLVLRWLAGSMSGADWPTIRLLAVALLVLLPFAIAAARALPVLELGPDMSTALGMPPRRADLALVTAVLLVAVAVAAAGPVAFVAFLSGPLARALNRGRTTVLGGALVGALVVVCADYAADYLVPGGNYPVGVVTGAVGAPFLLWLLTRRSV